MTHIEFFDKTAIENVATCLVYTPEKVLFLGDNANKIEDYLVGYREVFAARGQNITFEARAVSKTKLDEATKVLRRIIAENDECVFDITGGEELLMLALGIVCAENSEKKIQVHKINVQDNKIYDYDRNGTKTIQASPSLTVEENIRIYGGRVAYEEQGESKTIRWDLNEEFLRDIDIMGSLCQNNGLWWNIQIGIFVAMEQVAGDKYRLTTTVSREDLDKKLAERGHHYLKSQQLINQLLDSGMITYFSDSGDSVSVTYKDFQVKNCLINEGRVLEMRMFKAAREATNPDGSPVYQDAMCGVVIDWDGKFHDETSGEPYDTENEIDVMLMHGIVPVFISCKNGTVKNDELYKLNTVAERFGGKYAKKILIAPALKYMYDAAEQVRQRAEDMGIHIMEDVYTIDEETLLQKMGELWKIKTR